MTPKTALYSDLATHYEIYERNFEVKLLINKVDVNLHIERAIELFEEYYAEEYLKIKNVRFSFLILSGK